MIRPALVSLAIIFLGAAAPAIADFDQPSRGDPAVFALMAQQGFEPYVISRGRGVTLTKLCDIEPVKGAGGMRLYWLYTENKAAQVVHGRAELVVISHAGHVLGTYSDNESGPAPLCVRPDIVSRQVGKSGESVRFSPDRLPARLTITGNTDFVAVDRYRREASVDGIALPPYPDRP